MTGGAGITRRAVFAQVGGALAAGLAVSACGGFQAGPVGAGGLTGTRSPEATGVPLPELVWSQPDSGLVALAASGDTVTLIIDGAAGAAQGLDASTGEPRWTASSARAAAVPFAVGGGMVLCDGTNADGLDSITALDATTGRTLWSAPADVGDPGGGPGSWLTFADGAVYALIGRPGSHQVELDDVVLALDGRTGARKWMSALPPMATSLAVAGGVVYAGAALRAQSTSGAVVALDGGTGARRWTATVGAPVGALGVTGGVVTGCWDNLLSVGQPLMFGLDAADGRILWQRNVAPVLPTIAVADGTVFALNLASGALLAVDARTGRLRWQQAAGGQYPSAPVVAGDAVYVGYQDSLRAFSASTGQPRWNYPAAGLVRTLAANGGLLYAATEAPYALLALRG